jgi:hypothetical protein
MMCIFLTCKKIRKFGRYIIRCCVSHGVLIGSINTTGLIYRGLLRNFSTGVLVIRFSPGFDFGHFIRIVGQENLKPKDFVSFL